MTLPGAHNRFGLYNRGSRGMSKLPLHTTRIASIQRLQHWLTRGQGFAADCPPPTAELAAKLGGRPTILPLYYPSATQTPPFASSPSLPLDPPILTPQSSGFSPLGVSRPRNPSGAMRLTPLPCQGNPCPPFRLQRDPSRLGLVSASLAAWKLNQQKSIRQVRKRQWGNAKPNWISQPYSVRIRKSQEFNNSKYT